MVTQSWLSLSLLHQSPEELLQGPGEVGALPEHRHTATRLQWEPWLRGAAPCSTGLNEAKPQNVLATISATVKTRKDLHERGQHRL